METNAQKLNTLNDAIRAAQAADDFDTVKTLGDQAQAILFDAAKAAGYTEKEINGVLYVSQHADSLLEISKKTFDLYRDLSWEPLKPALSAFIQFLRVAAIKGLGMDRAVFGDDAAKGECFFAFLGEPEVADAMFVELLKIVNIIDASRSTSPRLKALDMIAALAIKTIDVSKYTGETPPTQLFGIGRAGNEVIDFFSAIGKASVLAKDQALALAALDLMKAMESAGADGRALTEQSGCDHGFLWEAPTTVEGSVREIAKYGLMTGLEQIAAGRDLDDLPGSAVEAAATALHAAMKGKATS